MSKNLQIVKKAYEVTPYSWAQVDDPREQNPYYSEVVWADSPGKAKAQIAHNEIFHEIRCRRKPASDLVAQEPHPLAISLTKAQKDKMCHALGVNNEYKFDASSYRDQYVVDFDADLESLIELGLIGKTQSLGNNLYYVTDLGREVIYSLYPIERWRKEAQQ